MVVEIERIRVLVLKGERRDGRGTSANRLGYTTGIPGLAESADLIKTSSPRRTYFPGGGYALLVLVTRRRELGGRFGSGIPAANAPGLFPPER